MNIESKINEIIKEYLKENIINEKWFHGTPDARNLEKSGRFEDKNIVVDYITDLNKYYENQRKMNLARKNNNENEYFKLLDNVGNLKKEYKYKKPVFLTDVYSVAKTYADPKRAFDYQNAEERVYEVDVNCKKTVKINATGDRFRFLNVNKVKQGFINSGIDEKTIDDLINMFNYYTPNNKGIQTDVIGAIGNWLGFDCIDVIGVLDSYHGGTTKSTVKMVLNPSTIKIKK